MTPRVLFLGGNGHSAVRLEPARQALAELGGPFTLVDVPYPGFEGRPRVDSYEAFLDDILKFVKPQLANSLLYATGISGLFALSLRARGELMQTPIILQGPVLWGLAHRWFPWLMRRGLWRLFPAIIRGRKVQRRFGQYHLTRPPTPDFLKAFFDGYQACTAKTDFFHWLTPDLLSRLEHDFAIRPEALQRFSVWWGGRDRIVPLNELRVTEAALGVKWPERTFAHWGHYPMIDEPEEWVRELSHALATLA